MFPNISREYAQIISTLSFCFGIILFITDNLIGGCIGIGIACWVMLISESILLTKVQLEMHKALENLSKKRETEIEKLLFFLKDSQLQSSPFESIDGAKKLCNRLDFPVMVVTANHQIIEANQHMHDVLGWSKKELNGKPAHIINDIVVMSKIGEITSQQEYAEQRAMITQYVYVHKSGRKIYGQMDATKIGDIGFFVVFHPSDMCLISYEEIRRLTKNNY